MDEHSYIRSIHRQLSKSVHRWKINARYVRGVPDCWYSGPGGDLWVEYKYLPRAPRRDFTPQLSANQKHWLQHRHEEGREVAVVIGTPAGAAILTDGEWEGPVQPPTTWTINKEVARWIEQQTLHTST